MSNGHVTTRTLKGALAGALAAAAWAFQQPLDKLVFRSRYDDVALLGRAVRPGDGWYRIGLVLHVQNGALFGALYANLAPGLPIPPALRGPACGLAEHFALWPLVGLTDRFHPARAQLPTLSGSRRAFAQATWRHLLFGYILGELEHRLNADEEAPPGPAPDYASNGHGSLERAVSAVRD
ncbi:MAG TPA: hypothetical protein VFH80_31625 [Solirubrobacteraceae bacterium]|nr:hypothetical protein [Solirubrobacteraceae bacterium]